MALLDAGKLNAGVTVFVSIRTDKHDAAWYERFSGVVREFSEVVGFYRMSGDIDYLLRVVPDIAACDRFCRRLIEKVEICDVSSSFSTEQIHDGAAPELQLTAASGPGARGHLMPFRRLAHRTVSNGER